jgi:hypothetical protein
MIQRLAPALGQTFRRTKLQLKYDTGLWIPAAMLLYGEAPIPGWRGAFVDLNEAYEEEPEGSIAFMKSEGAYSTSEESVFLELTIARCQEAFVNISDILEGMSDD